MKRLLPPHRNNFQGGTRPPGGFGNFARRTTRPKVGFYLLALLSLLLVTTTALAKLVPTEWEHRQILNVTAPGLVRVDLTSATFDAAGADQQDLRVIDANGREVAFLLDRPPTPGARVVRPASFDVKLESGTTHLTLATGITSALGAVTLETPHPFFLRAATIEISNDGTQWTTLDSGVPVFRQWGAEKLELPLGDHTATYVRITISDPNAAPIPFTGAELSLKAGPPPTLTPIGTQISRRDEFAGETVLSLALDARHVPLAALELPASDSLFMRRVTVAVREVNGAVSSERVVGSGTIYRVALEGSPARAQLEIPLDHTPPQRELLVHIQNGDSPPLALDTVKAMRRAIDLRFMAASAGAYTLLSGNAQATAPRYDLAAFAEELRSANVVAVVPGELETTPDYHPNESLSANNLPDVPLEGSPLDTKDWTQRKSLQLAHAGVQELELDPSVLAQTQSDFGDLRVLHAGNQIPYVLEQSNLARALPLNPTATPDAKRPSVSVWQVRLPQAGLPLRRLGITSTTPLFQRQFRIYEKLNNQNEGSYEITLTSGEWSRTPEPGQPETRIFEIAERAHTDTLWVETNNGDNPAIALSSVQAIYPVVRLIFKTATTDGFTLAYGNPSVSAPRYDLSLVAVKLLTSPRNPARTDSNETGSGQTKHPFASLNGGIIFWAALGLVVIVLLVVVAKLLPKPPAA